MSSEVLDFHLFADDTSLFYNNSCIKNIELIFNREFCNVSTWLKFNKLNLNIDKSNYNILQISNITLKINNTIIQKSCIG